MNKTIGKCGNCGGRVSVPTHFMSVKTPIPECESCGAQVDDTAHLPVMPMRPKVADIDHVQRETRTYPTIMGETERWPRNPNATFEIKY